MPSKCITCDLKQPAFNLPDQKKRLYCFDCKTDDMIDIKNSKCITCDLKQPAFNLPDQKKGLYCGDCKKVGMIDIRHPKCITCNLKRPLFNLPDQKKGLYCFDCKKVGMIDIKNPKCITCNLKRPYFNLPDQKKGLYCFDCKKVGMIDIKNPKCITCNLKQPAFNLPDQKKGLYCFDCKKVGMIDIKNPKCITCNLKQPTFNLPDQKKGLYCFDCKKVGMIDIRHPKCITPLCDQFAKIQKYCSRCYYSLHPDKASKRIKFRELEVYKFLQENFKDLNIIYNKHLKGDGQCLRDQPDFLIHLNHHSLIIECDENQHKYYNKECIIPRIHRIQEALNRNIIVIMFNPDSYIDENNKKIKGCFGIDKKTGLGVISKTDIDKLNSRFITLKDTINENMIYSVDNEPIRIIQLFYDTTV